VDTGALKVTWVTYQIIASTAFNLDITYPAPFSNLLGLFSFFSLDFLSLECLQVRPLAARGAIVVSWVRAEHLPEHLAWSLCPHLPLATPVMNHRVGVRTRTIATSPPCTCTRSALWCWRW
jgi:hypothetical protein